MLAYMLVMPSADHQPAVIAQLQGRPLTVAQAVGLWRLSDKFKKEGRWKPSTTGNKAVVLHIWLYHLMGGSERKLLAPPAPNATEADKKASLRIRRALDPVAERNGRFDNDMKSITRVADMGERQRQLDECHLRLYANADLQCFSAEPRSGGGGGGGGGSGGTTEWEQLKASMYAFLMGTHERSVGYASRDEPCAVRLIAHSGDLLKLIGSLVRGTARPELRPMPREMPELRRKLRISEGLNQHSREVAELACLLGQEDRTQAQRALRREEYAAEQRARAEQQLAAAHERIAELEAQCERVQGKLEGERQQHRAAKRALCGEAAELREGLRQERTVHGAARVEERRAQDAEMRAERVRLAAERDEAARSLAASEELITKLQQALEKVRSLSKSKRNEELEKELAAKTAELRTARARRTGMQKRVKELNLLPRRLQLAEQRAEACQEALADYCADELGLEHAMARANAAEAQIAKLRSELEAETGLREKFQVRTAPPPSPPPLPMPSLVCMLVHVASIPGLHALALTKRRCGLRHPPPGQARSRGVHGDPLQPVAEWGATEF